MSKLSESRQRKWLRGELPRLVEAGVLGPDQATAVERHYAREQPESGFGFILLAATGSALIGAGIILLVARNWDELSRPLRSAIAFIPLLVSLALGFFVLLRRKDSAAWREGAALLNIAGFTTALSLISQTWQIQGSFADFIAACLILALPVVYLFQSSFGAAAYLLGCWLWIVGKAGWRSDVPGELLVWLFLAAILPFYLRICWRGRRGWTFGILTTALLGGCIGAVGASAEFSGWYLVSISFAGLFVLFYLGGIVAIREDENSLNALTVLGAIAIAATAIVLSFTDMWPTHEGAWPSLSPEQKFAVVICVFFPVASSALAIWLFLRRGIEYSIAIVALPLIAMIGRLMTGNFANRSGAAFLLNLYTVVLGAELMMRGVRANSVTRANFGLLVIVALACARFFDRDLSFVARGLGFIAVGAAFLIVNLIFFRKRQSPVLPSDQPPA